MVGICLLAMALSVACGLLWHRLSALQSRYRQVLGASQSAHDRLLTARRETEDALEARDLLGQQISLLQLTITTWEEAARLRAWRDSEDAARAAHEACQAMQRQAQEVADLSQLETFVEEQARLAWTDDCGLSGEHFARQADASMTGKFNDLIHHLARRLTVTRPVGLVEDVIRAFVRGLA